MVADREFRSDLFYRLNVFPIRIPPLRDRKDDIPLLAVYFVQKFAKQMQKRIDSIPVATMKALTAWEWPGNIRELENFIERAVILTRGETLAAPVSELRNGKKDELAPKPAPRGEDDIAQIVTETIASLKKNRVPSERIMRQRDEICRVLTACKGRVGGADGAPDRMGSQPHNPDLADQEAGNRSWRFRLSCASLPYSGSVSASAIHVATASPEPQHPPL
jgi:transcriptional regulator with GAF, ATPase, and Fis domain